MLAFPFFSGHIRALPLLDPPTNCGSVNTPIPSAGPPDKRIGHEQLAYFDIQDVYLLGTNLWHSDSLIRIADQYVQGAVMADGFFAESTSPAVQNFVKKFEETYQEKPDFIEAVVFDSARILFHAVSRPHIRYRNEIRDELHNLINFRHVYDF